jgi:thiol-disulfide isomerase/thioredoxin
MNKSTIISLVIMALLSCVGPSAELKVGTWRCNIDMQGLQLPFQLEVAKNGDQYQAYIRNADEKILLDEVIVQGDSVKIPLHIFDATLAARIDGSQLSGTFIKNYAPTGNLPFSAVYGETHRFAKPAPATTDFSGKYQVEFYTQNDRYPAVGVFTQNENKVTGTFLTPTGDYRYLEGNVVDNKMWLSAFDGNHAFVFSAVKNGDSLQGEFFSGKSGYEKWRAQKNDSATMPPAESLTYLKPGYETLNFGFPDLKGDTVRLTDSRFRNKVVILQIFGTWCPNCMDETKFLSAWYNKNKDRGVEILGLAYERKPDFTYASQRVQHMKAKLMVPYDFVIAGVSDKTKASETLPALNRVLAFPTTIFVGKDGKVKHIHTGFSGPGTGAYYEEFVEDFNALTSRLLQEQGTAAAEFY